MGFHIRSQGVAHLLKRRRNSRLDLLDKEEDRSWKGGQGGGNVEEIARALHKLQLGLNEIGAGEAPSPNIWRENQQVLSSKPERDVHRNVWLGHIALHRILHIYLHRVEVVQWDNWPTRALLDKEYTTSSWLINDFSGTEMGRASKKVTLYQINLCKCIALNFETKPLPRNKREKKESIERTWRG